MSQDPAVFTLEDDPDLPGWQRWGISDEGRYHGFLGTLRARADGATLARVRMVPERRHSNALDSLHGGAMLGFIDQALFVGAKILGLVNAPAAVTLDLSTQFIGTSRIGEPIEAEVELLRETGRLLFLRGIVRQESDVLASFSATIRKPSRP